MRYAWNQEKWFPCWAHKVAKHDEKVHDKAQQDSDPFRNQWENISKLVTILAQSV